MGLIFNGETDTPDNVIGYTDFNFVGSKSNWKSTGGYVFMLVGVAICHSSKLQWIVALYTCEAKYIAMCEEEKKAVWLRSLLAELKS